MRRRRLAMLRWRSIAIGSWLRMFAGWLVQRRSFAKLLAVARAAPFTLGRAVPGSTIVLPAALLADTLFAGAAIGRKLGPHRVLHI